MNRQVEVTWGKLRTVVHSLMVHAKISDAYVHFALMYTADNIFLLLTIKDLINKYGEPTMTFKLAAGTKPSISHLRVLFYHLLYKKLLHMLGQRR